MATILNIETSTDVCSICIANEQDVLAIRETERSYSHSEVIALFIDECIKEAGISVKALDAVSISKGPGSYTALRIGAATAKGICYSLSIPLIAVGTLDALKESVIKTATPNDLIIPMIDARRKEVYRAVYNHKGEIMDKVEPIILDDTSFLNYANYNRILFCGDGSDKAQDILTINNGVFLKEECSATHMVGLSLEKFHKNEFEDIAYYEPYYYKGPNITVQKKNILR